MTARRTTPSLRTSHLIGACLAALWLALAMTGLARGAGAEDQRLPVSGNGEDAWIIEPQGGDLILLARELDEPPGHFHHLLRLKGRLAQEGAALGPEKMYLVYENLQVQSVEVGVDPDAPQTPIARTYYEPGLPAPVTLLSLAATKTGPWALLEVKDPAVLAQIDAPPATATQTAPVGLWQNPAIYGEPDDPPASQPAATAPASQQGPVDAIRLLRLDHNRWVKADLPQDMPAEARAWLVATDPQGDAPALVVEPPLVGRRLWVYQRQDPGGWARHEYTLDNDGDGDLAVIAVQGQVVVGRKIVNSDKLQVALSVLRPERTAAISVGTLSIDAPNPRTWGLLNDGATVELVNLDARGKLLTAGMDLGGQPTTRPAPVVIDEPSAFTQDPSHIVLVAVLAMSILLMFFIWRRDPSWNKLTLPADFRLADFARRAGAAAVDLAPCLFLAMLAFQLDLGGLYAAWPGAGGGWSSMIPGAAAIALFVLHTGVSEALTAKTLGKWMFGLSVMTMKGQPPNVWQVVARNLLKSFDLIAWYVLPVLAVIGPYRQRLGDLIGRTVVVRHEPPEPDEEEDQAE